MVFFSVSSGILMPLLPLSAVNFTSSIPSLFSLPIRLLCLLCTDTICSSLYCQSPNIPSKPPYHSHRQPFPSSIYPPTTPTKQQQPPLQPSTKMCYYQPNPPGCTCTYHHLIQPCPNARYTPAPHPSINPNPIVHVCETMDFARGVGLRVCLRCPDAQMGMGVGLGMGMQCLVCHSVQGMGMNMNLGMGSDVVLVAPSHTPAPAPVSTSTATGPLPLPLPETIVDVFASDIPSTITFNNPNDAPSLPTSTTAPASAAQSTAPSTNPTHFPSNTPYYPEPAARIKRKPSDFVLYPNSANESKTQMKTKNSNKKRRMSIAVSPKSTPLTLPRFMPAFVSGADGEGESEAAAVKAEREDYPASCETGNDGNGVEMAGVKREEADEGVDAEILARLSIGGAVEGLLVASQ
ncbi:hypothetical protein BDV19DRAFT_187832 [Aspergillus venezuelensis]